ncbi:hypothetical protein EX30DRAFT_360549 [Ascodesmis nigricans]|uniref:C3H1-type domain-containing protein n=1 Tax=Ascodesmis nigricans TaxID=341454 RepID=A0A4S2N5I5_9PEZI|nr:hypothetical protein EX30DRAFT_360549 [Ascodesmis nigricans]
MTAPNLPHVRNAPPKPVEMLQRNDPRLWSNGATICDMFLIYGKCSRPACIREHRPRLTNWDGSLKKSDKVPYCYDHYSLKAGCRRTPNCPLVHGAVQLPDYRDPSTWECKIIGARLPKADTEATELTRPKRRATSPALKTQGVEGPEDHSISVGNGANVIDTARRSEERKYVKSRAKPSTKKVRDMADEQQKKPLDPCSASGFGNTDVHVDGSRDHDKDTESTSKSEKEAASDSKIDGAANQEAMAVELYKPPIPRQRPPLPSKQLYIPPKRHLSADGPSVYYPQGNGIHLSRPLEMKRTPKKCSSTKNLPFDESTVGSRGMVRRSSISRTRADVTTPETLVVRPVPLGVSPSTKYASQSFDDTTTHQTSAEEPEQVLPPGEDTVARKNDVISIPHTPLPEPLTLATHPYAALATYLQSPLPSAMVDGVENSWNVARVEHPFQSQSLAPTAPHGLAHGRSPTVNTNVEPFCARDSALFNNASSHDFADHPPSIPTPHTSPNRFLTDNSSVPTNSDDNQLYTRSPPLPTPPSSVDGIMAPRPSRDKIEGIDEPEKKLIKDGAGVDKDSFGAQLDLIEDMKMRLRSSSSRHSSVSSFHEAPIESSRARVLSPLFAPNLINGAEPQQPHIHQTRLPQQAFPSSHIQHHTTRAKSKQYVTSTANIPQSHNISSPSPGHTAHPGLHQHPHVSCSQGAEIPSSPYPGYRLPQPDEWNTHVCFSCFHRGHRSGFCFYRTKCPNVMDKELLRSQRGVFSRFWTTYILYAQHNHKVHPATVQAHMHLLRVMEQGDKPDQQLLRPLFFVPTSGPSNAVAHAASSSVGTSAQSLPLTPNGNVQSSSMRSAPQNSAIVPGISGTVCNEPMNHKLPPHLRRKGITQPLHSPSSVVCELSEPGAVTTPQLSSSGGGEDKETLIQNPLISPVLDVQKSTHEEIMPVNITAGGVVQSSPFSDPRAANVQEAQDLSRQAPISVNRSQLSQKTNSVSCSAKNGALAADSSIDTSSNDMDENSKALEQPNGPSKCNEDKYIVSVIDSATWSSETRIPAPRESHETSLPVEQPGRLKAKQPAHAPQNQKFPRKISSESTGTFENFDSGIYQSHRRGSFNPTGQIDLSEKSPQIQFSREPSTPPRQPIQASSSVSSVKQFSLLSSSGASTSAHRSPASTTCWLCNKIHSGECNVSAYTVGRISNASPLPDWDPEPSTSSSDPSELERPDSLEPARPESESTSGNDFMYKTVTFPKLSGNQYAVREGAVYRYDQINHLEIVDVRKNNEHLNRLIMEANVAQERREFQESDSFHPRRKEQKKKSFFHWLPAEILIQIFQEVAGESEVLEKVDRICARSTSKMRPSVSQTAHFSDTECATCAPSTIAGSQSKNLPPTSLGFSKSVLTSSP